MPMPLTGFQVLESIYRCSTENLRVEEQNVNDTNNITRHDSTIGADLFNFIWYSNQSMDAVLNW